MFYWNGLLPKKVCLIEIGLQELVSLNGPCFEIKWNEIEGRREEKINTASRAKTFFLCEILLSFFSSFFLSHGHLSYFLLFISSFLRRSLFHTFFVSIFISIFLSHFCFIVSVFLHSFPIFSSFLFYFLFAPTGYLITRCFWNKKKNFFFFFSGFFFKKSKELLYRKKFLQFWIFRKIF